MLKVTISFVASPPVGISEPLDSERVNGGQTISVSFDTICLAVERRSEPADYGRVDDGQTNSVLFD